MFPALGLGELSIVLVALAGLGFWIWTLVQVALDESATRGQKVFWLVAIALTHVIGAAIFWLQRLGRRRLGL
jgi:Phospholipase_D-nuclease N-terminal